MQLTYARPKNLFIDWSLKNRPNGRHIIMCSGDCVIRHVPNDFEWSLEESIMMALAGDAGISSGLTKNIPGLLLGDKTFSLFEKVEKLNKISIGSEEFYQLCGTTRNSISKTTITIRPADWVIVNIHDRFLDGTCEFHSEYTNIEIV